jgi:hypothetical protein
MALTEVGLVLLSGNGILYLNGFPQTDMYDTGEKVKEAMVRSGVPTGDLHFTVKFDIAFPNSNGAAVRGSKSDKFDMKAALRGIMVDGAYEISTRNPAGGNPYYLMVKKSPGCRYTIAVESMVLLVGTVCTHLKMEGPFPNVVMTKNGLRVVCESVHQLGLFRSFSQVGFDIVTFEFSSITNQRALGMRKVSVLFDPPQKMANLDTLTTEAMTSTARADLVAIIQDRFDASKPDHSKGDAKKARRAAMAKAKANLRMDLLRLNIQRAKEMAEAAGEAPQ